MGKRGVLCKLCALIIAVVTALCRPQIISASPPEGYDFTKVAADAPYEPGELLVRFAPKRSSIQRSTAEKNQILGSLGGAILKRNYKIVPGLSLVKLPAGQTVINALKTYNGIEGILHAHPNYSGERDIDKQFRLLDGNGNGEVRIDMGADEYCNEGNENPADFNEDGIVETLDLAEMGGAWLVDANDPDWESQYKKYDLNTDDVIDFVDFAYFNQEWLWIACWKMPDIPTEPSMFMGGDWYSSSILMTQTQEDEPIESQPYSEPTIEEQITQIEGLLAWLYEVADTIDEDAWLNLTTSLEEMLKELEDSQ